LFADKLAFLQPYLAGTYPEKFALHRWTSEDGTQKEQFTIRVTEGEDEAHHLRNMDASWFVVGQGLPEQPELIYRGRVRPQDTLVDALQWLVENDDGRQHEKEDAHDEIIGLLDNSAGIVAITSIGAAIFGNHIQAMQAKGAVCVPTKAE
jgi:hypothetical protein